MMKRWLRAAALAACLGGLGAPPAASAAPLPIVPGEAALAPKAAPAPRLRPVAARQHVALPEVGEWELARVREANARAPFKHARRLVIGVQ